MQNKEKNKFTTFFKSYGFYLCLLAVCTVIASAGYFTSLNKNENNTNSDVHHYEEVLSYEEIPTQPPALFDTDTLASAAPASSSTEQAETTETIVQEETTEYSLPSFGEIISAFDDKTLVFSEYFDDWRVHDAIDFDGNATPDVYAAADGVVEKIYTDDKYGLTLVLSHADGCTTYYCSLDSTADLAVDDKVDRGELIGMAGDSCAFEAAQGKHLHFTAVKDGKTVSLF